MEIDWVHKDTKTINEKTLQYKLTMPLIDEIELQKIDNYYNEIVDEFKKEYLKEKNMIIAQRIMTNLREENKKLLCEKEQLINLVNSCQKRIRKQKEVIDRKNYLLKEQGAELKELYSEIDKLQGRIDKAIEYLEEPNRDSFDYSKAKLLEILKEVE